jgi:hypothetical protein
MSIVVTLRGGRVMVREEPVAGGRLSCGNGFDRILVLGGSGAHLIEAGGAGEGLAVDGCDLGGSGAIDGNEDDAARCGAVPRCRA